MDQRQQPEGWHRVPIDNVPASWRVHVQGDPADLVIRPGLSLAVHGQDCALTGNLTQEALHALLADLLTRDCVLISACRMD